MTVVEGQVSVFGAVAFVGQQPWVFSGTVRYDSTLTLPQNAARPSLLISNVAAATTFFLEKRTTQLDMSWWCTHALLSKISNA